MLARMSNFFEEQRTKWNKSERTAADMLSDVALERFQKFNPPTFDGGSGEEVAERWIETMEKIYQALNYSDERKVMFAAFQLEGPARDWWRVVEEKWGMEVRPKLWSAFRDEFLKNFIPKVVRDRKEEEFIGLRQETLTVAQYEIQFTKLSKYAPEMVNTEEERKWRFLHRY